MNAYTEWTYRLLFDRQVRDSFLAGDMSATGIPEEFWAEFATVDRVDLKRAAEKANEQILAILRSGYPEIFASWSEIAPQDPEGKEVVALYTGSEEFRLARNFAWSAGEESMSAPFGRFLMRISSE